MPRFKRLCLSIAGTASVALASLPLAIGPASATRVPEGTTPSILVMEASSNASQFNLGSHRVQGSLTELVGQTKNLKPIASIPTPVIPKPTGTEGTAGGCPSGSVRTCPKGGEGYYPGRTGVKEPAVDPGPNEKTRTEKDRRGENKGPDF